MLKVQHQDYPKNLFIPREALQIQINEFEGPLDLLVYLVKKQKIEISKINLMAIIEQYLQFMDFSNDIHFELSTEYYYMATFLTELKSRKLLPSYQDELEEETKELEQELMSKIETYSSIKEASTVLNSLKIYNRDFWPINLDFKFNQNLHFDVSIDELSKHMEHLLLTINYKKDYDLDLFELDEFDLDARIDYIQNYLNQKGKEVIEFSDLLEHNDVKNKLLSLLAILQLAKAGFLKIMQNNFYEPIYVTENQ